MEVITPNSEAIKRLRLESKSQLFIRIGKRKDILFFSRLVADKWNLKRFDRVQFVKEGNEVWARKTKADDAFVIMVDGRNCFRICDGALVKWLCKAINGKAPLRAKVTIADDVLYFIVNTRGRKRKPNG